MSKHLTDYQVHTLNEKHGWFEFGDAQSDVSKAFAHDAIDMFLRMQNAGPALFNELQKLMPGIEAMGWDTEELQQLMKKVRGE